MLRPPGDYLLQCPFQNLHSHSRYSGDHVDADGSAGEYLLARRAMNQMESLSCTISRMAPVHPAQDPVIQRLHPHTDACYPQFQQSLHILRTTLYDILRIHLDGKFGIA